MIQATFPGCPLTVTELPHARIAYTLGGKTDELALGFSDTDYQC